MASAGHLAPADGRDQKEISIALKESISVPILDASGTGLGDGRRRRNGLPRRLVTALDSQYLNAKGADWAWFALSHFKIQVLQGFSDHWRAGTLPPYATTPLLNRHCAER